MSTNLKIAMLSGITLFIVIVLCCGMGSGVAQQPVQAEEWTGVPGNLTEWGYAQDYIYGVVSRPQSNDAVLVMRTWEGESLGKRKLGTLPRGAHVIPVSKEICGTSVPGKDGAWPYGLVSLQDGKILHQWELPKGVSVRAVNATRDGRIIVMLAYAIMEDPPFVHQPRIGLIDVEKGDLQWVADFTTDGSGYVRQIAISDDRRYVAIAGVANGTLMFDLKEKKTLWNKRPQHEISTRRAVFAPDGKHVYTAGSEGCVYVIDTLSGEITERLWGTISGTGSDASRISAFAMSADGKWIAAGVGPNGQVHVWRLGKVRQDQVFGHGGGSIEILSFSPDSKHLVSVGGGMAKVWALTSAQPTTQSKE